MQAASWSPSTQMASRLKMQARYWRNTVMAMMQLSHLVFESVIWSWSIQRVEATELEKHRQTSTPRQKDGQRCSPQRPLHGR